MSTMPGEAKTQLAFYALKQVALLLCLFSGFVELLNASDRHIV